MTESDINEAANINFLRDLTKVNLNEKIRFTSPPIWAFLMGHFDGYREYSDYQSMCRSLATMVYFEDLDLLAEYDNRKSALHFLVDGRYIEAIYIMLKALHLRGEINETRKEYFKEIIDTAILSYKGPTHDKKQRAIISSVEGKVIDAKSPIEVLAALGVLKLFNTEEINDLREQAKKHARSIGGTVNGHIPHDMPTLNCLKSYLTPGAVEQTPLDHTRSFR